MQCCPSCGSFRNKKNGSDRGKPRLKCTSCGRSFYAVATQKTDPINRIVVTSAINNCAVNRQFLNDLKFYCEQRNARLLVIPIRYKNPTSKNEHVADEWWADELTPYLFTDCVVNHTKKLQILGDLKIQATTSNPLSGLDSITKGLTTVIGHPQVQMKTVASHRSEIPTFLMTTGAVTVSDYSSTKAGYFAGFNHSFSAVVIEEDEDFCHVRQIHFDVDGIRDFGSLYSAENGVTQIRAEAVVLGDEHVLFHSTEVKNATFDYPHGSLVPIVMPKYLVRHDVLDAYSISHHHSKDFLRKYAKTKAGLNDISSELRITASYLRSTTPSYCTSIVVASNHNSHLAQWLNSADPKLDIQNAKLYHALMYRTLDEIDRNDGEEVPDPFQIYMNEFHPGHGIVFATRRGGMMLAGVECGDHGDIGVGGSRGSRSQYAKLDSKSIIGHSHSPGIDRGCYQVGTSSKLQLEYNLGPSAWSNTHCVLHTTGKRQLINIIKGRFTS